jgi:hypothetical protein
MKRDNSFIKTECSFLSKATNVLTKSIKLPKGQGQYFILQAENTTNFNSIFTNDMGPQSVNKENPVYIPDSFPI